MYWKILVRMWTRFFISKALYVKAISNYKESEKGNKETKAKN